MHEIQEKMLELSKTKNVLSLGYRPLGRLIGVDKPQLVKHHLTQLQKKGLIKPQTRSDVKKYLDYSSSLQPDFVEIPVVGAANCGSATLYADEHIEQYMTVSEKLVKKRGNIFALIAKGDSMNEARINGETIEDNDYVIIDGDQRNPRVGDFVLSIISGCANIKEFARTKDGNIALLSRSKTKYAPIYISTEDDFIINGKVIQVIKAVK